MSTKRLSKTEVKQRHNARVVALQRLYALDQKAWDNDGLLGVQDPAANEASEETTEDYISELVEGLLREKPAVDALVDRRLQNWTIHRLAVMDRSLLRLGCYELLFNPSVPTKVVINEYIELAKIWGSESKTPKLVNGVLDAIAKERRTSS